MKTTLQGLFIILLISFSTSLWTQTFDVDVNIALTPPYPSNLDAYADFLEQGIFEITNNSNSTVDAYFDVLIEETSGKIRIDSEGALNTPVPLEPGLNILTPSDIQEIFAGTTEDNFSTVGLSQAERDAIILNRQMPEGEYRICIFALDEMGNPLSNPNPDGCAIFDVLYAERPVIIDPFDGDVLIDTTGNILITWDHNLNSIDATNRTEYIVKIIDITEQSIGIEEVDLAMLNPSVSPEYEENVGNISSISLLNDFDFPMIIGHQYALRVSAEDPDGQISYQYGGHSEVHVFQYGIFTPETNFWDPPRITSPSHNSTLVAAGTVEIKWEQNLDFLTALDQEDAYYEFQLLDVTGKNEEQINALFSSPETEFMYNDDSASGWRKTLNLSSQTPFEIGKQYAVRVKLSDDFIIPDYNEINNGGYSDIVVFTYGNENDDFQPELDTLLANHIQGQVLWAWKASEDEQNDTGNTFIVTDKTELAEASYSFADSSSEAGETSFPLANATIIIYGQQHLFSWITIPVILGTGQSDEQGRFAIEVNHAYLSLINTASIQVIPNDEAFSRLSKDIELTSTDFGFLTDPVKVAANSMQLSVQVLKSDQADAQDAVSVNLLLHQDNYEAQYYQQQVGTGQSVEYNNDTYQIIKNLDSGDRYNHIFQNTNSYENYVLQVAVDGRPSQFYPMSSVYNYPDQNRNKNVVTIHQNLTYNVGDVLEGTIYFGDEVRSEAKVEVTFNAEDVLGEYSLGNSYIRMTDSEGRYYFDNLPRLKKGSELTITVTDHTIRQQSWIEKVVYQGENPLIKDIYLTNDIYTAFGRVLDQYGLPVANAQIQVSETQTTYTSDHGFYMVKIQQPLPYELSIVADGYEDAYTFPAFTEWYGGGYGTLTELPNAETPTEKAQLWKKDIEASDIVKTFFEESGKTEMDATILNIGSGTLTNIYQNYIENTENLKGNLALYTSEMKNSQDACTIKAYYNDELVEATIKFSGDSYSLEDQMESGKPYVFSAPNGFIPFSITPIDGGPEFVQFFGEIEMDADNEEELTIYLEDSVLLSGFVKDKVTKSGLAEATVAVEGMDFTTTTDENGAYKLYVPMNEEFTYVARKTKYNKQDTTFIVSEATSYDFFIEPRDGSLPDYTSLSLFPVTIDEVEKTTGGFIISGELTFNGNDLFTPASGENTLNFKDVVVFTDPSNESNAIPSSNFQFEEAELNIKAFGFAPVLASSGSRIELQKLKSNDPALASIATIGAHKLTLLLDSDPAFGSFPFKFPRAILRNQDRDDYTEDKLAELGFDIKGDTQAEIDEKKKNASTVAGALFEELNYEKLFVSPKKNIKEINKLAKFNVQYIKNEFSNSLDVVDVSTSKRYDGFVVSDLLLSKMLIKENESSLDQYGIHMEGALELPHFIGMKIKVPDNRVEITKLSLGKNFTVNELAFKVRPNNPLTASIKTWEARFTELKLYGLGTTNLGLGFGGDIRVKKDPNLVGPEAPPHLTINTFKVVNQEGPGISITADLSISSVGIKVGPLVISQQSGKNIWMQLNTKNWGFDLKASGLKVRTESNNKFAKKIFPQEILQFNLSSADWSALLVMNPNIKADFGAVKVNIDRFLLNYGYNMSMDAMNELMKMTDEEKEQFFGKDTKGPGLSEEDVEYFETLVASKEKAGLPVPQHIRDVLQDHYSKGSVGGIDSKDAKGGVLGGDALIPETDIGWAFGIAGGVQFPLKGFNNGIHASLLLARNGNNINFRMNEILLQLEQPAFKLKASAALSVSGSKIGFEAQAEMETLKKKFAAGFKFYKYSSGNNFEIGANLTLSTKIVTGPVLWHKIGGGFDFNTYSKKYKVFVTGSAGPIGTPQNVTSIDDARVNVLFDLKNCGYQPIVSGYANLTVKGQQFGRLEAEMDFCRMSLYLDINNTMEFAAGLITAKVGGTIYALKDGNQGRLYLGLNAKVTDKLGIFNAYGLVAVGVNFKKTSATPSSLVYTWNRIPSVAKKYGRFHGLALALDMKVPRKSGDFGIKIGSFDLASFDYYFYASAYAHVYKSFDKKDFEVYGKLDVGAGGNLKFLGSTFLGGSASAKLTLKGGYDYSWHFAASGSINFELYNKKSMRCNTSRLGSTTSCSNLHYPCGAWWCFGLCEWCCCKRVCVTVPDIIPDFKTCFGAKFSYSKRQGGKTYVSFSKN